MSMNQEQLDVATVNVFTSTFFQVLQVTSPDVDAALEAAIKAADTFHAKFKSE